MSDGSDPCNIGIMHPAFRVGKKDLLDWINSFFELNYTKVEECATGAIYCQICDCLWKGSVPMSRINWDAKSEYEYMQNFKFAQTAFKKRQVTKDIPIMKLTKAKFQDNLEFLQWCKHFFDCKYNGDNYNAKQRRAASSKGGKSAGANSKAKREAKMNSSGASSTSETKKSTTSGAKTTSKATKKTTSGSGGGGKLTAENEELKASNKDLQDTAEGLEKERDFYFSKLREVEILAQDEEKEFSREIVLEILYKTEDTDEVEGDEEEEAGDDGDDDDTF